MDSQLKRLMIFFCDLGGSSKGVRSFLQTDRISHFMDTNPKI